MSKDSPFDLDFLDETPAVDAPASDPEPESDTVVLVAVNLSFFETNFVIVDEDTLYTFNRTGTEVPADKADQIIDNSATHGVVLTRKAN